MTGPDHFLEAERLTRRAALDQDMEQGARLTHLRAAQVHATLALAAATALAAPDAGQSGMDKLDFDAWDMVCGVRESPELVEGPVRLAGDDTAVGGTDE